MTIPLGVGLIGCGNISTTYLRLAPLFAGFEIRGIADRDPAVAQAQGVAFGVPDMPGEELLGAAEIDIVVNLTVPDAHFAVSQAALAAGKHVYSEKPLALSLAEGLALREAADAAGRNICCAPDTFLGGAHQFARKLVDDGAIGRIVAGTAHVMSHGMEHWHPNPDFFFQPGGGPILDIGPYHIAQLINLIGPVRRVAALTTAATATRTISSAPRRGETIPVGTPTNIHALLDFEQGATVTIGASWDVWAHRHGSMEIYGTDGSLFLPDPNFFGGAVALATPAGAIDTQIQWDHPFARANEADRGGKRANYRAAGLADMAAAILHDREPRCSLDRALHALDVMTAILRSGETGAFVDTTTTCTRPAPLHPDAAAALLRNG